MNYDYQPENPSCATAIVPRNDVMYTACGYGMQAWVQCLLHGRQLAEKRTFQELIGTTMP
jgi:hypothetical protein